MRQRRLLLIASVSCLSFVFVLALLHAETKPHYGFLKGAAPVRVEKGSLNGYPSYVYLIPGKYEQLQAEAVKELTASGWAAKGGTLIDWNSSGMVEIFPGDQIEDEAISEIASREQGDYVFVRATASSPSWLYRLKTKLGLAYPVSPSTVVPQSGRVVAKIDDLHDALYAATSDSSLLNMVRSQAFTNGSKADQDRKLAAWIEAHPQYVSGLSATESRTFVTLLRRQTDKLLAEARGEEPPRKG